MVSMTTMFIMAVIGSFVAGAFVASPELRAYAAATITSADIVDETIQSVDIKNGQVKAADIATNAVGASEIAANSVGASELAGVTKLIFSECAVTDNVSTNPGDFLTFDCTVTGSIVGDDVIATKNGGVSCFGLLDAVVYTQDHIAVFVNNDCTSSFALGSAKISIIVYDT